MTTWAHSDTIPTDCRGYLTPGKRYAFHQDYDSDLVAITDDLGCQIHIYLTSCAFLDNAPWTVTHD